MAEIEFSIHVRQGETILSRDTVRLKIPVERIISAIRRYRDANAQVDVLVRQVLHED